MYTADFNWISLVALIVFALVGALKPSRRQKNNPEPRPEDLEGQDEDGGYTIQEYKTEQAVFEQGITGEVPQTDYYRKRSFETSSLLEEPEEETGERADFDIRQAVIASEILKRPEF